MKSLQGNAFLFYGPRKNREILEENWFVYDLSCSKGDIWWLQSYSQTICMELCVILEKNLIRHAACSNSTIWLSISSHIYLYFCEKMSPPLLDIICPVSSLGECLLPLVGWGRHSFWGCIVACHLSLFKLVGEFQPRQMALLEEVEDGCSPGALLDPVWLKKSNQKASQKVVVTPSL